MALQAQYHLRQSRNNGSRYVIFLLRGSHRRCFCVYVYCLCASGQVRMRALEWCCHKMSIHQRHSSSSTMRAVFRALAFVPVVTVYVCGWGTPVGDRTTTNITESKH